MQIENLEGTIRYYEGTTRVQNMDLLAPDDPVRQLDQDYQTLKLDFKKLASEKARLMEELHRVSVVANQVIMIIDC